MKVEIDPTKEVVEVALAYLHGDDVNPDVGMGMFPQTAIRYAVNDLTKKYGIDFVKEVDEETAFTEIMKVRSRR